jgi:membrane associated rhomboid family serine protease
MLPLRDRLPTRSTPVVSYAIVVTNVLAFLNERMTLASLRNPERWIETWGLVPRHLLADPLHQWITVFSSMFLHSPTSWAHLAGNMLYVWIFADNVEDSLGSVRFAAFYLVCGMGAAAAQVFSDPSSTMPMVGASGAISGVLAAYMTLYPRSPITVLNPVFLLWFFFGIFLQLPAWFVIGEFFVVNIWQALTADPSMGGVAFLAHVGGFVTGWLLLQVAFRDGHRAAHDHWRSFRLEERRRAERDDDRW